MEMEIVAPSIKICSPICQACICRMVLVEEEEAEHETRQKKDDDSPTARLPSAGHRPVLSKTEA
jgi:hypothetical protein